MELPVLSRRVSPQEGFPLFRPLFEVLRSTRQVDQIYLTLDPLDLRVAEPRTSSGRFNYILRRGKKKVSPHPLRIKNRQNFSESGYRDAETRDPEMDSRRQGKDGHWKGRRLASHFWDLMARSSFRLQRFCSFSQPPFAVSSFLSSKHSSFFTRAKAIRRILAAKATRATSLGFSPLNQPFHKGPEVSGMTSHAGHSRQVAFPSQSPVPFAVYPSMPFLPPTRGDLGTKPGRADHLLPSLNASESSDFCEHHQSEGPSHTRDGVRDFPLPPEGFVLSQGGADLLFHRFLPPVSQSRPLSYPLLPLSHQVLELSKALEPLKVEDQGFHPHPIAGYDPGIQGIGLALPVETAAEIPDEPGIHHTDFGPFFGEEDCRNFPEIPGGLHDKEEVLKRESLHLDLRKAAIPPSDRSKVFGPAVYSSEREMKETVKDSFDRSTPPHPGIPSCHLQGIVG